MTQTRNNKFIARLDWTTILIWLALLCIGVVNIYAAVYNGEEKNIFDLSLRSGMQVMWIAMACLIALLILVINSHFYATFTPIFYIITIVLMLATLLFGRVVNGSKSWLTIGPMSIQSVEFMKLTTALMVARVMNAHNFDIQKWKYTFQVLLVILVAVGLSLWQHDTGSALVFCSFLLVFYRAGLPQWIVFSILFLLLLFVLSLLIEPHSVVIFLSVFAFILAVFTTGKPLGCLIMMIIAAVFTTGIYFGCPLFGYEISFYYALLIAHAAIIPIVIFRALWRRIQRLIVIVVLFVVSISVNYSVDYVFDNVLKEHQRHRINNLLGIESDLKGWGYNVHQSKIAIGSGGFAGKGYLEGTQTKFNFVPEQSTDFIFCTIGEEWGFVGALVVVALYFLLLWRIIAIAERQKNKFAKYYGYSIVSILVFHVAVNLGMTIGIMPVIGIPLPFISYGGSSLWAFTMMLFILLKLDVAKYE
ncbi:rod shape-determining protein RodA [Bacteroidia bacterium]|nr:rod shape-determining protein RodA [Bacteroidia bacterium]